VSASTSEGWWNAPARFFPAAVEILKKLIPTVYANDMFQSMGRDLTLKAIQQYEPGPLSDENLAKIQAEFDKIPAKE
jgi:hypothetical protein